MSTQPTEQNEQIDAKGWFDGARAKALAMIEGLKGKKKDNAFKEFLAKDGEFVKDIQAQIKRIETQGQSSPVRTPGQDSPRVNPQIERDIASFREKNPEFNNILKNLDRTGKEELYTVAVMQKQGLDTKNRTKAVAEYQKQNPTFTSRLRALPDDRLENSIALNKMKERGYSPVAIAMERFLNRPENAGLKADVLASVAHIDNPAFAKKIALTEKAPAILKQRGIKL